MEIIVLAKLQIACLVLSIFISALYFSSSRQNTKLHVSFSRILIILPIYLLSDIATVVTVNNIETMSLANDICHRIFFIAIIATVYLFCNHMKYLIEQEEGAYKRKNTVRIISVIIFVLASLYSLFAKPEYSFTSITGFAATRFACGAFGAVGLYIFIIIVLLIKYWKILPKKKRRTIYISLIIETIGLYFQIIHTELLLSGMILTLMMLTFYLTLDNPDAILLAKVEEEKRKADEANASKSAFLSVVSHEIRTPMNAIVGMTELLLREKEDLNEKQEKYLKNIKNSGDALVMIVNDILDQSKIEAGKMEIVDGPYELRSVSDDVKMIIENRIGTKPIDLNINIDKEIPESIIGDGLRIRQIMINLMNNAVKFTEKGNINLTVSLEEKQEDKMLLKFSVSDTGQGIKEEDLGKLGEAFTQVDTKKNHNKEGTGLGLNISRDFISMMGGQLQVVSEYGKGSEFFFTIWQGVNKQADTENKSKKYKGDFVAKDARVLVVDDTEMNLVIAVELMKIFGIKADTAKSGENALECIKNIKYDMIFMDYMMPDMDGVETTGKIRKYSDETGDNYYKNVPIITLSGDNSEDTKEKFRNAGINDYADKPINLNELRDKIIKWLPEEMIELKN